MVKRNSLSHNHCSQIIKAALFVVVLLIFAFTVYGKSEEVNMDMVHTASTGNDTLVFLNESVYYLENHNVLLGKYALLYRICSGQRQVVSIINHYVRFAGQYCGRIVLRITESSFTNYPTHIYYSLFNPMTDSIESMPQPIENIINQDAHVMIQGYDDELIIHRNNTLLRYSPASNQLMTIGESPFEFINLTSTYCFAKRDRTSYFIFSNEGKLQVIEKQDRLPTMKIRIPGTDWFFCFVGSADTIEVKAYNISNDNVIPITTQLTENVSSLVLSIDSSGENLYFITHSSIKRYNLRLHAFDDSFDYKLTLANNAYISDIIIYEDNIIYLVHDGDKNRIVMDSF